MTKITGFYLNKARYQANDNLGKAYWLEIDYWNNSFRLSCDNPQLKVVARSLLKKKHKVNFAPKLLK